MTDVAITTPVHERSNGRALFWAGIGLSVLAFAVVAAQYRVKVLIVPWYLPVLTTIGTFLLLGSVTRRRSVARVVVLGLIGVLAGLQWLFLVSFSKLPNYEGPARAGQKIPAFHTTLASGDSFTDKNLQDGTPSVLVFFRGRW